MVSSGCVRWLKKRTNLEKTLLSLLSLLLLALLLMILIGITCHGMNTEAKPDDKICWSKECMKTAGDVLSIMESKTDPCTNLYDFTCGKYGQEPGETLSVPKRTTESVYFSLKRIMESEEKLNVDGLDDATNFYNSCVKFGSNRQNVGDARRAEIFNLMSEVGIDIWPVINSTYNSSQFSQNLILASLILLDVPVVFKMEIIPDKNLAGSYLIKISPGGPHESGRSLNDIRDDAYLKSRLITSFILLGDSSAHTDAEDMLYVDGSFAEIERNKTTKCDDVKVLAPREVISELNKLTTINNQLLIDWTIIMGEIQNATGLLRPFAVELHCLQKIKDYADFLELQSKRSVANYLGWRFFTKFAEHVIPAFEKSRFGTGEVVSRWRVCLELMEKFASPILADVLTKKMINKEIQDEVAKISNAALTTTQRLVSSASWLSDAQRSRIRKKVARIRVMYPFQKKGDNELIPVEIPQVNVNNFTAVVVYRQRQWVIQEFRKLNEEMEPMAVSWTPLLSVRTDSLSSDLTVFVYFDRIRNPYMKLRRPKWMNYGGFGVSVAREISKVLMSMNAEARPEENTALWNVWSRSRNSSMCLVKSLAARPGENEEALTPDVTERLMKDIFLDQSSVEIAYETATTISSSTNSRLLPGLDFSNGKHFFLSYAQTLCEADMPLQESKHIPVKDRLNMAVLNFKTFNNVFSCPPSSSQCQIWA